jgi:hypothetical protein
MKATEKTKGATGSHVLRLSMSLNVRKIEEWERERFDGLLREKHYLGQSSRVGDFLRQVVERDGQWVALLVWGPAALKLKDREAWMGWNGAMAAERLKLVVQNRRYLLLVERGEEPNLASAVLAASCRALPAQWQASFGYEPLVAESFTDPEAYHGTCYKASGWEAVGMSAGSSRAHPDFYVPNGKPKCLWLRELRRGARKLAVACPLLPEHEGAVVDVTSGKMPLSLEQRRSLKDVLRQTPDPRGRNTRFRIGPVLCIVTMALLCGARQVSEIARFATRLRPQQRRELGLPLKKGSPAFYEVPTYGVFHQVLSRMDPVAFGSLLTGWLATQQGSLPGTCALDGKMIRDLIGTVSLVDVEDGSPVAVAVMDQKEGTTRCEMKVAQDLLHSLPSLKGKTVTADPLHCQKETARAILDKDGDYLFQIKGNQPSLLELARIKPAESPFLPKPPADTAASKPAKSASAPPRRCPPGSPPVGSSSKSAAPDCSKRPTSRATKNASTSPANPGIIAARKTGST